MKRAPVPVAAKKATPEQPPAVGDLTRGQRVRAEALRLAIMAAPYTAPGGKIEGVALLAEAEHIEAWLLKALA